jgi:hypothetical protein
MILADVFMSLKLMIIRFVTDWDKITGGEEGRQEKEGGERGDKRRKLEGESRKIRREKRGER